MSTPSHGSLAPRSRGFGHVGFWRTGQSKPDIVLSYTAVTDFASVFVAVKEGLFKKRHLDIELKFIPLNSPIPTAIPAESLQMGGQTTCRLPSIAPGLTWDGFWRLIYDRVNAALQRQANLMLEQGRLTVAESRALVNARNDLLLRIRSRLTPFGELYSELLKPDASLRSFEQFAADKGSIEAVLRSVGRTRAVGDTMGVVSRVAGPAAIVVKISLTALVIRKQWDGRPHPKRHRCAKVEALTTT